MFLRSPTPIAALAFVSLCAATPALSASWHVCTFDITVTQHETGQTRAIHGIVGTVAAAPAQAECPIPGQNIRFRPETADYQTPLRYRDWPAVGETARWRYIYLDGNCKNDGNPAPCRIAHYPQGW